MYYLFIRSEEAKAKYLKEFEERKKDKEAGKAPVFSEMRAATTDLIESIPYNIMRGCFLVLGTILLNKLGFNELINIAAVMIINCFLGCVSNFFFALIKNELRRRFCRRLGIDFTEKNVAVIESLEYSSF